jgi:hypothetical protein
MEKINNTAREWGLFSDMEGADEAAEGMNRITNAALAQIVDAIRGWHDFAETYSEFGSTDSEPCAEFVRLVKEAVWNAV